MYRPTPAINHDRLFRGNGLDPLLIRRNSDGTAVLWAWGNLVDVAVDLGPVAPTVRLEFDKKTGGWSATLTAAMLKQIVLEEAE